MALNVLGINADEDFYVILDALEHRNLVIRGETGQNAGGMHVIEKLPAHFEIKLPANFFAPSVDVLRLQFNVFFTVKTDCAPHSI